MQKKQPIRVSSELQFNVAQLLKEGTGATRGYDVDVKDVNELDDEIEVVARVIGQVKFLRTGSDILVTGSLATTIQKKCGRCLTTFITPVSIEMEEEFYPTLDILTGSVLPQPPEADEANRIDDHHILDLSEVVRQEFLLASDSILYCRPDCKGLCPHCGRDRNTDPCDCRDDVVDLRWAGLMQTQTED